MAEEMGISAKDLEYAICNKEAEGTPFHNCEYVAHGKGMFPCHECVRIHKEDYYKKKMYVNEKIVKGDV